MITNITIKNIKGYGDPPTSIDLEIKTNKVNLLMAPNGTGKSSIAAAFRSLKPHSLDVDKDEKYHKDEALPSEFSITLDGNVLVANSRQNTISSALSCYIINSNTSVCTTHKNIGGKFSHVSGYLDITDIVIKERIPADVRPNFPIKNIRKEFGINGKLLPNNPVFTTDRKLWKELERISYHLNLFPNANKRLMLLRSVIEYVNSLDGTVEQVRNQFDETILEEIEQNPIYKTILGALMIFTQDFSRIDLFLFFYEVLQFWLNNKDVIKQANERTEYERFKTIFDRNLQLLDTTWKGIHTVEENGKLIVQFPHADEISNGQRDILTFVVELLKFKTSIKDGRKYLLLIDEVFDYIDDANTIAAQYFLTSLLEQYRDNIYLCILTHLNPFTFKNYIFSDSKVNHVYLQGTVPAATPAMKAFIAFREGLDKNVPVQEQLYKDLSHDLFHYNPLQVDYSARIQSIGGLAGLRATWGKTSVLHTELIAQINAYLSGNAQYDPYAVALALRLRVEKCAYSLLATEEQRSAFVNTHMTKGKFQYCENVGIELPEILNVVNAIHNDADHLKFDAVQSRYIEKPMVYKLQHNVIKTMVGKIFGWNGTPLSTDSID